MDLRCLYPGEFVISESPVWCDRSGCLWWVSMVSPSAVFRLRWGEVEPDVFPAPQPVTGLVLAEDGLPLVGSTDCIFRLEVMSGDFVPVFAWAGLGKATRCNEMGVDPWGNLWVGTMTNNLGGAEIDPSAGTLVRITAEGRVETMRTGLGIPNTLAWADQGRSLLSADSLTGIIFRYRLDTDGRLAAAEKFHGPSGYGLPDGSALARDGNLWNARWSDGSVMALSKDGVEVARLPIAAGNVTSACFAGPNLDCLVVTTARWGLPPEKLAAQPCAGAIMCIDGCGQGSVTQRFASPAASLSKIAI